MYYIFHGFKIFAEVNKLEKISHAGYRLPTITLLTEPSVTDVKDKAGLNSGVGSGEGEERQMQKNAAKLEAV